MVVVDTLDEWLDLGSSGPPFLPHPCGHRKWIPIDSGHDGVTITLVRGTIIIVLEDDGFSTSVPT